MNDFGNTLRQFRERAGMSTADVAAKTHMIIQQVEDLEHENFNRIAAPIYGRGFVKLYCNAVGIDDPRPFINEFMEIYNGNRESVIQMKDIPHSQVATGNDEPARDSAPPAIPAEKKSATIVGEGEGNVDGDGNSEEENILFEQEVLKQPDSPPAKAPPRFKPVIPGKGLSNSYDSIRRYKKPLLRCSALLIVLVGVLWAVCAGIGAAYKALTTVKNKTPQEMTANNQETKEKSHNVNPVSNIPSAETKTKTKNIPPTPPLYID